jgi:hypothetical protein
MWVTDKIMSLRVSDEELLLGLDVSKHGERAIAVNDILKMHEQMNGSKHGSVSSMHVQHVQQGNMAEP